MYIDAGLGQSNPIILSAITSGPKFPRSWRIRISQIHCGSIYKADQGCLQFSTGVSGRIRSFNFDTSSGRQLSNQDYSICVRMERNFCSVQYSVCPDPSGSNRSRSFTLSGNSNTGWNSTWVNSLSVKLTLSVCVLIQLSQQWWEVRYNFMIIKEIKNGFKQPSTGENWKILWSIYYRHCKFSFVRAEIRFFFIFKEIREHFFYILRETNSTLHIFMFLF